MARQTRLTRTTLAAAMKRGGRIDAAKFDAFTDDDIERMVAGDDDLVADATRLGEPLPDIKAMRRKLGLSQEAFAKALRIPAGTIRNWEQRRTMPDPAAISLFRIVERDSDAAFRALGSKIAPRRVANRKTAA